jgi:hypothetical protein
MLISEQMRDLRCAEDRLAKTAQRRADAVDKEAWDERNASTLVAIQLQIEALQTELTRMLKEANYYRWAQ